MTSPSTDAATQDHFTKHQHFGLNPNQLFFFQQVRFDFLLSSAQPRCMPTLPGAFPRSCPLNHGLHLGSEALVSGADLFAL